MASIQTPKGTVLIDDALLAQLVGILPNSNRKRVIPINITRYGYVEFDMRLNGNRYRMKLHQLVVGRGIGGNCVDHINGNKLDNRRENLRVISHRDNNHNRVDNLEYVGVKERKSGRFQASIRLDGKLKYIGTFDCPIKASNAYTNERVNHGKI